MWILILRSVRYVMVAHLDGVSQRGTLQLGHLHAHIMKDNAPFTIRDTASKRGGEEALSFLVACKRGARNQVMA